MRPTRPEFDPNFVSEGQPDSTRFWTLRAQPDPKTGRVDFIRYITGLKPDLNQSTRPNWIRFWILRANPTRLKPKIGPKIGLNPEKWVGFHRTICRPTMPTKSTTTTTTTTTTSTTTAKTTTTSTQSQSTTASTPEPTPSNTTGTGTTDTTETPTTTETTITETYDYGSSKEFVSLHGRRRKRNLWNF